MSAAVFTVDGLTKRFGEVVAVRGVSFDVHGGEIFGLLGPNGAGKTTTLRMLCGLLRPDGGRVLVDGHPLGREGNHRGRVGVCPQDLVLWQKLTCMEQLEFAGEMQGLRRGEARRRGEELLASLGLAAKARALASELSGGMQRRLNLALALVHDPEIVVLDEPGAGLDPQSRVLVREFIRGLARRKTIVVTTHDMDEAERLADRVGILDRGTLLVLDTPEALKRAVGEGDLLEVEGQDAAWAREGARALAGLAVGEVHAEGGRLLVRARDAVGRLPAILEALRSSGFAHRTVRLRAATLEDVFIALTGRGLRE